MKNSRNMIFQLCKFVVSLSQRSNFQLHKPPLCYSITPLFFSSSPSKRSKSKPSISVSEYLISQHQFSPEAALKASLTVAYLKETQQCDSVISFLKESGFSKSHIEKVIKKIPRVLSASLENTIKPKIKIFQELCFSPSDIADIISGDPWILTRSADNRLVPSILVLKSIIGSNADVVKALKLSGWFLRHDLEKTMMPNIEFMRSCGISSSQIVKYVFSFPRFFLYKPDRIVEYVKRIDEMGFDRNSKMFLTAIRTLSSMTLENWELKLKLFKSLGFSENDILVVFRRVPQVFAVSERKIRKVTETLLSWRSHDISLVVNHPELLIYSVERRLKPRLDILEILEKKNLLHKFPSLIVACKISDKQFSEKYVVPYLNELEGKHVEIR